MPVTTNNIVTQEELAKWSYLSRVQVPRITANVDLLIGTNAPKVLQPWEVVNSRGNGPYAVRTVLGWVVSGVIREGESSPKTGLPVAAVLGSFQHEPRAVASAATKKVQTDMKDMEERLHNLQSQIKENQRALNYTRSARDDALFSREDVLLTAKENEKRAKSMEAELMQLQKERVAAEGWRKQAEAERKKLLNELANHSSAKSALVEEKHQQEGKISQLQEERNSLEVDLNYTVKALQMKLEQEASKRILAQNGRLHPGGRPFEGFGEAAQTGESEHVFQELKRTPHD